MKNRVSLTVSSLFCLLFLSSCKCKQLTPNAQDYNVQQNTDRIVEKTYNLSKTMLLVTSFKNDLIARKIIDYNVLDVETKKILKCGSFEGTKLVWYTNTELKGYPHIGIIKENNNELLEDDFNTSDQSILIEIK